MRLCVTGPAATKPGWAILKAMQSSDFSDLAPQTSAAVACSAVVVCHALSLRKLRLLVAERRTRSHAFFKKERKTGSVVTARRVTTRGPVA